MPTEITPNGKIGRRIDRRERLKKLKTERDSLKTALQNWTSNATFNAVNDVAGLKAELQKLRPMIRDLAQAVNTLISLELEAMADEEAG